MGLKRYHDAVKYFAASERQCGEHHVTAYNSGISWWYLDDFSRAHADFSRSVRLKPEYAEAATWVTRCEARLAGDRFKTAAEQTVAVPPASSVAAQNAVVT